MRNATLGSLLVGMLSACGGSGEPAGPRTTPPPASWDLVGGAESCAACDTSTVVVRTSESSTTYEMDLVLHGSSQPVAATTQVHAQRDGSAQLLTVVTTFLDSLPVGSYDLRIRVSGAETATLPGVMRVTMARPRRPEHLYAIARVTVSADGIDIAPVVGISELRCPLTCGVTSVVPGEAQSLRYYVGTVPYTTSLHVADLAPNCHVTGSGQQTVTLEPGTVHDVVFTISCTPIVPNPLASGSVRISIQEAASSGRTHIVRYLCDQATGPCASAPVSATMPATLNGIPPGVQGFALDAADGCTTPLPFSAIDVDVRAGETVGLTFAVLCQ